MLNSIRLIGCYIEYKPGTPIKIYNDTEYIIQDSTNEEIVFLKNDHTDCINKVAVQCAYLLT
jgi:hypothetical protein